MNWKTEKRKVNDLIPFENNPRQLSNKQAQDLEKSLRKFNLAEIPVINTDDVIIAGHQRLKILQLLGRGDEEIDVRVPDKKLTKKQLEEYNVRSNKNTGSWDWDILANNFEIDDLIEWGFSDEELAGLDFDEQTEGLTDDDAVPEEVPTICKTGDLWQLGNHRLLCGDATKEEDVARLMGTEKAVLMNTDPPYGIDYASILAPRRGNKEYCDTYKPKYKPIENDDLTDGAKLQEFLEKAITCVLPHLIENPAFYLWHPMLTQGTFFAAAAAAAADILIHRQIIWVKPSLIMGRGDYHWRHELCFYGWIKGKRCNWYTDRKQTTVWEIGKENDGIHPTQKPVELFERPIVANTKTGDVLYEPFAGSGSQFIAAEKTNRKCCGLEIDEHYCDVIIARWEEYTGKKAEKIDA